MLYFAYGSNLLTQRLLARVPQAKFEGAGKLVGWRFAMNVRSSDGSAKANAIKTSSNQDTLHGVLYELDAAAKTVLDGFEDVGGAYRVEQATADTGNGRRDVFLYVGEKGRLAEGLAPYDWYRGLILAGARQHSLPTQFTAMLEKLPTAIDPDSVRAAANWKLIPAAWR